MDQKKKMFAFINTVSIVFLIVTVVYFFYVQKIGIRQSRVAVSEQLYFFLVTDFLFFNTLHVPMTFALLFTVPGFRKWLENYSSIFRSMKLEMGIAFGLFFLISLLGGQIGIQVNKYQPASNLTFFIIYHTLFWLLASYHGIGQVYGISMIINKEEKHETENITSGIVEKFLFQLLPMLYFFRIIQLMLSAFINSLVITYATFFRINYILLIGACCAVFINAFFSPKTIRTKKVIFLSRIFIYPFVGLVPIASFAASANHGIEYLYVVRNVISNQENKKLILWTVVVAGLIWGILTMPRYFSATQYFSIGTLTPFLAVLTSVDLLHYWLDKNIFRFRNPVSLKYIGSLIK